MAGQGPHIDRVTESFYAWELRGRGWTLAPYPVDLEPPHRPFFVLPDPATAARSAIDDGKRPTLISSLVESALRLFASAPQSITTDGVFEEQEPFPQSDDDAPVCFQVSVPPDFASDPPLASAIIRSLLRGSRPSSFEVVGHAGKVTIQFAVPEDSTAHAESMLTGFLPDATIVRTSDLLLDHWDEEQPSLVVDFGLANEFFLPINVEGSFAIDPLIPLVAALGEARGNEVLALQVLFQRTANGWSKTIREALRDDVGDDVFLNAPSFTILAKEKTESPIIAVVLRVAVSARSAARVHSLARGAMSYIAQFERGGGNAFIPLANDDYDHDAHALAALRRESFRTGMLLSLAELAQLVHVPDRSVRDPALARQSKRSKVLPGSATGHELRLGTNVHRGAQTVATVPDDARLSHMHIVGASGTGKSTLLLSLITQDIANGHGVMVVDPHGDLIEELLARIPDERANDVCLFDPADQDFAVGFNVLRAENEVEKNLIASDIVSIFRRLATSWGDAMTTVLGNAVLALLEHPSGGTLVELRQFLVDDGYRRQVVASVPDPHIRFFWEKEYPLIGSRSIGPILTRLDQFLRAKLLRQIVAQQVGGLDMTNMVREKRIILVKLSQGEIGSENAYLLGSLLIAKLHQVALSRQRLPPSARHPYFCYIDECQHFISESMAALLSEARKYGVGFTLAHQTLAQMDQSPGVAAALMGNAYTRIVFRVGDDDAKKLGDGFTSFEGTDLRALGRGEAVARLGGSANDFNLRVLPLADIDPGTYIERASDMRTASNRKWASPRPIAHVAASKEVPSEEMLREPEASRVQVPIEVVAPVSAPERTMVVVPKGGRQTKYPDPPMLGRGGKEHKYLQHLVKRLAEERGWRATIEEPGLDGASVDVVLRRGEESIGVEISVTTSAEHEVENLKKCAGLGFTRMLFIAKERAKRERVADAARTVFGDRPFDALAPEDIAVVLDTLAMPAASTESTVRGYTVMVSRQRLTPEDVLAKRKAVAQVIARSMKPG